MAKRPTPDTTALGVRERMLLFCIASGTDWQRAGVTGEIVTALVVKGLLLSCPPAGPTTVYESLFSNSRHTENFVFTFVLGAREAGVSKDAHKRDRAGGHPSRRRAAHGSSG